MIHSRLVLGIKQYKTLNTNTHTHTHTNIILTEPDHRDPEMYLANTFSYGQRCYLAEHAHQETRQMLRSQKINLSAKLVRHGINLRHDVMDDSVRYLSALPKHASQLRRPMATLQKTMTVLVQIAGLAGLQRSS